MLIFSESGPRNIDDREVAAVYLGGGDGRYTFATLVMADGTEVSDPVANDALARVQDELADPMLPAA